MDATDATQRGAGAGPKTPAGAVTAPEAAPAPTPEAREAARDASLAAAWAALPELRISERQSDRSRLVSHGRQDPAHGVFDMLRTRVAQAMAERGWRRLAITSPTKDCGKTFVSSNLALSLARRRGLRVGLMDLDLRLPSLAHIFGVVHPGALGDFLDGGDAVRDHFRRFGDNLAIAVNGVRRADSAELLNEPAAGAAIARAEAELGLGLTVFDLPPMLACDDVIAFLPHVDCVLLVAGGGVTRAEELRRCAKLIEDRTPVLGIVLNQADDPNVERYYYGYGEKDGGKGGGRRRGRRG